MVRLKELFPKEIKLNLVYYEDKPIAGSLLFVCNKKVVICFYNMLLYEYQHLKPIYLIMYETVRWAVENGFEWVDIGVSQDTSAEDPMTPSINLINFKERFHSRGIVRSLITLILINNEKNENTIDVCFVAFSEITTDARLLNIARTY
jgi:lipid II:glycine glycyltransferase (peptidoglycan interpeptide bridge formation enzyme)